MRRRHTELGQENKKQSFETFHHPPLHFKHGTHKSIRGRQVDGAHARKGPTIRGRKGLTKIQHWRSCAYISASVWCEDEAPQQARNGCIARNSSLPEKLRFASSQSSVYAPRAPHPTTNGKQRKRHDCECALPEKRNFCSSTCSRSISDGLVPRRSFRNDSRKAGHTPEEGL